MGGFFQLRYMMALVVAVSIDTIQFLLGIAVWAVFHVPAVAGAIVGCAVVGEVIKDGCWLGAALGGAAHVGANIITLGGFQALLVSVGAGFAVVLSFAIAVPFGVGLIALMAMTGIVPAGQIFSWRRLWALAEIVPGINFSFSWTCMVIFDIMADRATTMGGVLGGIARVATAAASGNVGGTAKAAAGAGTPAPRRPMPAGEVEGVVEPEANRRGRAPLSEIRGSTQSATAPGNDRLWQAANDNTPARAPNALQRNIASKALMSKAA